MSKMIRLAMDGIVSLSLLPLRMAHLAAIALSIPFHLYLVYNFARARLYDVPMVPDWSSLILATILFGAANLVALGVLGEYAGRIYAEVKRRPIFLVEECCGRDVFTAPDGKEENENVP